MAILLDQRDDGSLALYYDGDLQFDSHDEAIYHEALSLPALALAERRHPGPLRALICGGGDGLVARELLKSEHVEQVTLVDYDSVMLELARGALATLNAHSLTDPACETLVQDAWAYTAWADRIGATYELIVVDLTVPQDLDGARFHTIEWYERLGRLLGESGVLAVNAASPSTRADAYWSIYNSLRAAALSPRPYRIALPSFTAQGYGDDWGFVLASPRPIIAAELDDNLPLAEPRRVLRTPAQLRRLFVFPEDAAARRATALPSRQGSGILLHYLYNSPAGDGAGERSWNALALPADDAPLPTPEERAHFLPPELRLALAVAPGARADEETLFQRVIDLMPALHRHQTREMIAAFLEAPENFLASIDLSALVDRLLRRAAELPRRLVVELRLLRARLRSLAGDHGALLRLGLRIVTVVALVVIVANLLFPDTVYGKGGASSTATSADTPSLASPSHSAYDPRAVTPDLATNSGYRQSPVMRDVSVDEVGSTYPARRYSYRPSLYGSRGYTTYHGAGARPTEPSQEQQAAYRLTPETDILDSGQVVVTLSTNAYLLLEPDISTVIDQSTGEPLLYLKSDPAQVWRAAKEIDRQRLGLHRSVAAKLTYIQWLNWLEFTPWQTEDVHELENLTDMAARLDRARETLGTVPDSPPPLPSPPVADAFEIFSGVWLLPDGSALALVAPDGVAYMDGKGWYRDPARTQALDTPYPDSFRATMLAMLQERVRNYDATFSRLEGDLTLARTEMNQLQSDLAEYTGIASGNPPDTSVEYGSSEIPLSEALRRTNEDIARATQRLELLQQQLNRLPSEMVAARNAVTTLGQTG